MIYANNIIGLCDLPTTKMGIHKWLRRQGIDLVYRGNQLCFDPMQLPEPEHRAFFARLADQAGLEMGTYDDAAHAIFLEQKQSVIERAKGNAMKLLFHARYEKIGLAWPAIEAAGKTAFGSFPARNTIKGWKAKTKDVDPANWAPALAPGWTGPDRHPVSAEAWAMMIDQMELSGNVGTSYPIKWACKKVAKVSKDKGWNWQPYHTIRRRWNEIDPIQRLITEVGEERAGAMLRMTQSQHTRGFAAMDIVDGDGKRYPVRVKWPDGEIGTPWVIAFTDRASKKTVGWAVGKSENGDVIDAAIRNMCESNYRPIKVGLDNGGALNSHRIAGGQEPFFRKKQTKREDWEVPGVLQILGIELVNKGVGAKTSNLQENGWSNTRHAANDPSFFGAQQPGPNDPVNPHDTVVPVAVFEQVMAETFNDLNENKDNRVKGLNNGESRNDAFERLLTEDARRRVVTEFMRRRLDMIWRIKTVQKDGRIKFDGGMFGDHTTQVEMLYHVGKKVLIGFNPKDFNSPAMVCHWGDKNKRGQVFIRELPAFEECCTWQCRREA